MKIEQVRGRLLEDLDRLRSPEGYLYAGSPRYHTLFGRDALISGWQTLARDPSIARATLHTLAELQGKQTNALREEEPGKILHEHRSDPASQAELSHWGFPYFGSVDSTPLFLILAGRYLRRPGDTAFLHDLWPNLTAAYGWTVGKLLRLSVIVLVAYVGLLALTGWRMASAPTGFIPTQDQGYLLVNVQFSVLARQQDAMDFAIEAELRALSLQRRFNEDFWVQSKGFALGLDGAGLPRNVPTSNPGHLLFTGILRADRISPLVDRLFEEDLWTPFGIRTHSASAPDFDPFGYHTGSVWPHDNWLIAEGLRATGHRDEANRVRGALLRAYERLGRIPEFYAVVDDEIVDLVDPANGSARANPLQAWAIAGLLELL